MPKNLNRITLVADVGGTNTRIALAQDGTIDRTAIQRYANRDFDSLHAVIQRYCDASSAGQITAACVAIAGPVENGTGHLTNLNWSIDHASLKKVTGADTVAVINDLQAQAHALQDLPNSAFERVLSVPAPRQDPQSHGAKLVIGIGTGCNAALALTDASGVRVPASETGHIGLPVRSQEDLDLMLYLQNKQGFASVEHVLAGSGLETVYQYFAQTAGQAHSLSAHQIMAAMADASDPLARQTVQITVRLLAQLCADLALIHLPYGGIYLVGGVARALMPYLKPCDFAASFYAMGRFSKVMERFEVALVHDDYAALTGCANALDGLRS